MLGLIKIRTVEGSKVWTADDITGRHVSAQDQPIVSSTCRTMRFDLIILCSSHRLDFRIRTEVRSNSGNLSSSSSSRKYSDLQLYFLYSCEIVWFCFELIIDMDSVVCFKRSAHFYCYMKWFIGKGKASRNSCQSLELFNPIDARSWYI